MIVYKNILQQLKNAGYNTGVIMRNKILSQATVDAIRHNRPISIASINTICKLLKCQPGDILEYVDNPAED